MKRNTAVVALGLWAFPFASGFARASTETWIVPSHGPDGPVTTLHQQAAPPEVPDPSATAPSRTYDLLWHRDLPDPIYTTTGISEPSDRVLAGNAYVSACGKHVHAGISGRGGDLYALRLQILSALGESLPPAAAPDIFWSGPNPSAGPVTIGFRLDVAGPVRF